MYEAECIFYSEVTCILFSLSPQIFTLEVISFSSCRFDRRLFFLTNHAAKTTYLTSDFIV